MSLGNLACRIGDRLLEEPLYNTLFVSRQHAVDAAHINAGALYPLLAQEFEPGIDRAYACQNDDELSEAACEICQAGEDGAEQRDVARLYDEDAGFREQVNRYIHDFEAMLRTILAQRDGSPLGVTLLSSDMGKLYVALAQAIERLR